MPLFGPAHVTMLVVFVLGVGPAWAWGRSRRHRGSGDPATRTLGAVVVAVGVGVTAYDAATRFELATSLPLQLSDLAWMSAGAALWTRSRLLATLTWFWSVLTLQAVVTPSLGQDFPDLRFVAFWTLHLLTIWSAVVLVAGLRITPAWHEYRVGVAVTVGWAVVVGAFNAVTGTNYGYLARKPAGGSALDLLGPWPVYLLVATAVLCAIWAAMTWPWARTRPSTRIT